MSKAKKIADIRRRIVEVRSWYKACTGNAQATATEQHDAVSRIESSLHTALRQLGVTYDFWA